MNKTHSPLPWKLNIKPPTHISSEPECEIIDADGERVADNEMYYPCAVTTENQMYIVKAVNLHEALCKEIERLKANVDPACDSANTLFILSLQKRIISLRNAVSELIKVAYSAPDNEENHFAIGRGREVLAQKDEWVPQDEKVERFTVAYRSIGKTESEK